MLNHKKIHLQYCEAGSRYVGIFTIHALSHPRLSNFLALRAQGEGRINSVPTLFTITFDSYRANKISKATNDSYEFEADLGELQPLQQVSHIWDAVKAEFDREIEIIGPIREIP